ncbi:MAG TPA: hypothetical protein VG994_11230, partial [Steroidobacteraceae bacterium]|nr:hypothetical protein [Steroidobacteraceae bacterium]
RDALNMDEVNIKEAEMNALADQALADFAAREGITLPGAEAAPAAPRSMGTQTPSATPASAATEKQGS